MADELTQSMRDAGNAAQFKKMQETGTSKFLKGLLSGGFSGVQKFTTHKPTGQSDLLNMIMTMMPQLATGAVGRMGRVGIHGVIDEEIEKNENMLKEFLPQEDMNRLYEALDKKNNAQIR